MKQSLRGLSDLRYPRDSVFHVFTLSLRKIKSKWRSNIYNASDVRAITGINTCKSQQDVWLSHAYIFHMPKPRSGGLYAPRNMKQFWWGYQVRNWWIKRFSLTLLRHKLTYVLKEMGKIDISFNSQITLLRTKCRSRKAFGDFSAWVGRIIWYKEEIKLFFLNLANPCSIRDI